MTAKTPVKGHASKHVHKAKKHHKAKGKHHPAAQPKPVGHGVNAGPQPVHTAAKPPSHAKPRGFAVGDLLPVCAFEALAMSLRLAGQFVHDDEVAGLWELAGAPPLGASLGATLDAASLHGLAGLRPQRRERLERLGPVRLADEFGLPGRDDETSPLGPFKDFLAGDFHDLILGAVAGRDLNPDALPFSATAGRPRQHLILGVDVPGPHAVLATADGWWSWGELHAPWPCRIEEAWAVAWA